MHYIQNLLKSYDSFVGWAEFLYLGSLTYYVLSMHTELEVHTTVKKLNTFIGHTLF